MRAVIGLQILWMLGSPIAAQTLCSWMEAANTWSSGAKLELTLEVPQTVQDWNLTFSFDTDVTFEAWKGDITKHSSQLYSLTNKCYNGKVYHCQCFKLGIIVRYCSEMEGYPVPRIYWNSAQAPTCASMPDCDAKATTPSLGCNSMDSACPGFDAVCEIPGHGNCAWCDGMDCKTGCASDTNCPADRPVCGAVTSHECGCNDDGQCMTGKICENGACIDGCRNHTGCIGWDAVCTDSPDLAGNCAYCMNQQCVKGCVDSSNCQSSDSCDAPDHSSCFYCDNHVCSTGCSGDDVCPESYPICGGGGGPGLCGCRTTSDCKVGYNCIEYKCSAPPGKVLLTSIKTYTKDCVGCSPREGTIIMLLGERNLEYPTGVPCQTQILDMAGTQEYAANAQHVFTGETVLGGCFEAALNAVLQFNGGNVTWVGDGVWTPETSAGICTDWSDDTNFVYTCDLDGPTSGGSGTVWDLVRCDLQFQTDCP